MARAMVLNKHSSDIDNINLSRALARLEQKILSQNASPRLQHSNYERTKTAANLEYARTLLLRLEHETSTLKIQSRKQAAQSTLLQQRNLLKRLNDRLYELGQQDNGTFSDSSTDEDLLGEENPPPSLPSDPSNLSSSALDRRKPPIDNPSVTTLRNRHNPTSTSTSTPTTTTTAHALHPTPAPGPQAPTSPSPSTTTATLLESSSTTQATLTSSLLTLASALKASSLALHNSLESEKALLSTTTSSLEKNSDGMQAADKKMGMLRRVSEGRGWWGRMLMYAWIAGLWVVAILLVFVGPKLRF